MASTLPIRTRPRSRIRAANLQREYTAAAGGSRFLPSGNGNALEVLHGDVDDLDLRLGWEAKEQMDKDPFCAAAIDTRALGATARPVEVEPAPESDYLRESDRKDAEEIAAFFRRMLMALKGTQRDINLTAFKQLREALKVGHSKAEVVFELQERGIDAGKQYVARIKGKTRHNTCFMIDRQGTWQGVAAYTGNGSYIAPYGLPNMARLGVISAGELGGNWRNLPPEKWFVIINDPPADDSPLGTSLYRRVYTAYRNKRDAWAFYLRSLDNTATPFLDIELPENAQTMYEPDANGNANVAGGKVDAAQAMYKWALVARNGGILVRPNGGRAQYLHAAQSGDPFAVARTVWNSEITQGILLQGMATTQGKTGAYAMAQVQQDVLDLAMRHDRRQAEDALFSLAQQVVRLNFPERLWHLTPHLTFGEVELNDFAAWARAFKDLAEAGLLVPSQIPRVWSVLGLPQGKLDELWDSLDFDKIIQQQITAPVVNPTTGATEPSMEATHTLQEYSKRRTRGAARRRAGRTSATGAL